MIVTVALIKAIGILPEKYEVSSFQWFRFIMINLTPALLVGIGVAYTDLKEVIQSLSLIYLVLVSMTIIGATIGSAFVGNLLGFYPL